MTELADLVHIDLTRYLEEQAGRVDGPVYAVALFTQPDYGSIGAMLATETAFERSLADADVSEEEAYGPALRWYSGDWDVAPEFFCGEAATAGLMALRDRLDEIDLDDPRFSERHEEAYEFAYRVAARVRLPSALPITQHTLVYVEADDNTLLQSAERMLRTVPLDRFHEAIPMWRSLSATLREARADAAVMARVRELAAADQPIDTWQPSRGDLIDQLAVRLRSCGLSWDSVGAGDPADDLARAASSRRSWLP